MVKTYDLLALKKEEGGHYTVGMSQGDVGGGYGGWGAGVMGLGVRESASGRLRFACMSMTLVYAEITQFVDIELFVAPEGALRSLQPNRPRRGGKGVKK